MELKPSVIQYSNVREILFFSSVLHFAHYTPGHQMCGDLSYTKQFSDAS